MDDDDDDDIHSEIQDSVEEEPLTPPRRSGRARREPQWLRSGDFITKSAITSKQEWQTKAEFMIETLKSGILPGLEKEFGQAIIDIVRGTEK